ncbi:MAG TPA: helix-turn-helix transcriptional regulator [Anaerolineales bacterium]|nr:helix-turn-helix transcriptional regulator [Anaerolineales bacterium]
MDVTFANWLNEKMREHNWSQSDLARASGLTRQAISYYLSQKSKQPDEFALQRIAHALKLPPEQVYRAAGILPPKTSTDEMIEQILHEVSKLPKTDQEEILAFIRMKNNLRKKK